MNKKPKLDWKFSGSKDHPVYITEIGRITLMIECTEYFEDQGWSGWYWMPSVDGVKATEWGIEFRQTWNKDLSMLLAERHALYLLAQSMAKLV